MADTEPPKVETEPIKKVPTKEELKALRLAKAKALAAAHGTKESNVNNKAV